MVKNLINSLKDTFNATGIAFEGHSTQAVMESVDARAEAREQEKQQQEQLNILDNNYARHTPDENENIGAPGRLGTNQAQARAQEIIQKQKKEKELARFLTRLQEQRMELERQINWTIEYFEQKAEEAAVQAGELRQKIVDNTERMIENSNFIRDIEKLLEADKEGISVDKEKLKKLLKDKGVDINDSTPLALLLQTAEKMVVEANEENALLEVDNDIYDKAASKFEVLQEKYSSQAIELQAKLDELNAQGLSDEEYQKQADKILEDVPHEVKKEYEKKHQRNGADIEVQKENIAKKEVVEEFDVMAFMDETSTEEPNQSNRNTTVSLPSPNGM